MNSTIILKKKVCKSCGHPSYIFSKGRCEPCARVENAGKNMEKYTNELLQKESLSDLIGVADHWFSQYVRLKAADDKGRASCFTCGFTAHWTLLQCGHYMKRAHLFLRFDERNCRCQCFGCNELKHGNMAEFTKRLEAEQPGITDILKEESVLAYKPTRDELNRIISEYRSKVNELKRQIKTMR